MSNELQVILDEQQVAKDNAKQLLEAFGAPFEEAGTILATYQEIKVTDEEDFVAMAEARDKRLILKRIRTGVENKRKELKSDIVKVGRAIDSVARFVKENIEPAEKYLEEQEKFAEIKAAERAAKIKAERIEKLAQYTDDISLYNFESMSDEQFDGLLSSLQTQKEAEAAALKKAEEDKIAAEKAERERQAEIEAENARLKAEAEKREKEAAAERAKLEAENEKRLAEERAKAEEERKKREALEAEKRAAEAAEAREKAEAEEAERQALLSPDKEKIVAYANKLSDLRTQAPVVKTKESQQLLDEIDTALATIAEKIIMKAKQL